MALRSVWLDVKGICVDGFEETRWNGCVLCILPEYSFNISSRGGSTDSPLSPHRSQEPDGWEPPAKPKT